MSETAAAAYIMGHNNRERRRLALQASILHPFTEHLFRRAGITTGMDVVEVGCGVGDVSLLAARLVGRTGSVTSVDFDPVALRTLDQRAGAEGLSNITSTQADIHTFAPDRRFDAVVGRHILIHTKDPLEVLKDCRNLLHPRGIGVFQEYDFQLFPPGYPGPTPVRDSVDRIFTAFFKRAVHGNMGSRLYRLFCEAGFDRPDCRGEFPVDGGPDSPHHEWITEALRSVLAAAAQVGIEGAAELDIDTLEASLREEARSGASTPGPIMYGCFGRRAD